MFLNHFAILLHLSLMPHLKANCLSMDSDEISCKFAFSVEVSFFLNNPSTFSPTKVTMASEKPQAMTTKRPISFFGVSETSRSLKQSITSP